MNSEQRLSQSDYYRHSTGLNTNPQEVEEVFNSGESELVFNQTLYESLPCIHFTLNSSGNILALSQYATECLGYSAEDLIGKSILSIFHPQDQVQLQAVLSSAQSLSQSSSEEFRHLCKDGSSLWVKLTTRVVQRAGVSPVILLVCEALSDRKQLENALREYEKRMCLITDAVSGKICYVDAQQRYLFVNKRFEEWYGLSGEAILGIQIKDLPGTPGKEVYPKIKKYIEAVLSGENLTFEFTGVFPDGKQRSLRVNYVPDIREAGEVVGFVIVCEDLTECRQLEEALRQFNIALEKQVNERTAQLRQALEFEATLKRIAEQVRDSLDEAQILQTAVQALGRVIGVSSCNAALYDFEQNSSTICYEYTLSSTSSCGRVVSMADFAEIYQQLHYGQDLQFCPLAFDSNSQQVAILACPILDNQEALGDLWLTSRSDYGFSEQDVRLVQQVANHCAIALRQARLYQLAQDQVQALEKLHHLKDDFLSTVSHELRTPLTNLRIALRMMKLAQSQDKQQQYFDLAVQECEREIELINDLLDLQRLEADSYQLSPESLEIQPLLTELVDAIETQVQTRGQHLYLDISADLESIYTDSSLLERILRELLNNASKYTDREGQIRLQVMPAQLGVQITVSNAAEIREPELPRLFDKFYRVPQADRWRRGGTGLGLSLIKQMVERLEGTISVSSKDGWTTFTVYLPN